MIILSNGSLFTSIATRHSMTGTSHTIANTVKPRNRHKKQQTVWTVDVAVVSTQAFVYPHNFVVLAVTEPLAREASTPPGAYPRH